MYKIKQLKISFCEDTVQILKRRVSPSSLRVTSCQRCSSPLSKSAYQPRPEYGQIIINWFQMIKQTLKYKLLRWVMMMIWSYLVLLPSIIDRITICVWSEDIPSLPLTVFTKSLLVTSKISVIQSSWDLDAGDVKASGCGNDILLMDTTKWDSIKFEWSWDAQTNVKKML